MCVQKFISIVSITVLLAACASTPEKLDIEQSPQSVNIIEAENPKTETLSKRVFRGTLRATKGATKKTADLTVDGAQFAVNGTVKGVKASGSLIVGTGKTFADVTRWTGKKIGDGMQYILTAPAVSDASNPVGNKTITDAALSPLSDFNIRKRERPEVLMWLEENEIYHVDEAVNCDWLDVRVDELDEALGADFDVEETSSSVLDKVGNAGKGAAISSVASAVGEHVPGRSMIRSVSGAKAREKRTRELYQKGVARRSYLKGMAKSRGCEDR